MGHFIIAAIAPDQINLVLHQSDERGDNNRHSFTYQCRQLIAKALAAARRHDDKRIAPGKKRFNHFLLRVLELVKPKVFLEGFCQINAIGWLFPGGFCRSFCCCCSH